jgi:UTP:GlnB (protein PII) uridylyltransferase
MRAGYLAVHGPADLARHDALLTPRPRAGEVRVVVTPCRRLGEWRVDVGARDGPGLLASFTAGLTALGVDVLQAVVGTWDGGAAVDAFVVRSARQPDSEVVRAALVNALDASMWSVPIPDAVASFDNSASSVYTACEVRVDDRPGVLHAIAVAITAAGADVHAARVETVDGVAVDRFDLSTRAGGKLDAGMQEAIRLHLAAGVAPGRRGRFRRGRIRRGRRGRGGR